MNAYEIAKEAMDASNEALEVYFGKTAALAMRRPPGIPRGLDPVAMTMPMGGMAVTGQAAKGLAPMAAGYVKRQVIQRGGASALSGLSAFKGNVGSNLMDYSKGRVGEAIDRFTGHTVPTITRAVKGDVSGAAKQHVKRIGSDIKSKFYDIPKAHWLQK